MDHLFDVESCELQDFLVIAWNWVDLYLLGDLVFALFE